MLKWFCNFFAKEKQTTAAYQAPEIICSKTLVLCGPCYADITYTATFLLDTQHLKDWALDHSKNIWSSNKTEQQAREALPNWLLSSPKRKSTYVAKLDYPMRQVLMPYIYDFYLKGWLQYYCHECKTHHHALTENDHDKSSNGDTTSWVEEWLCPNGHIIHSKQESIRWITRRSKSETQK